MKIAACVILYNPDEFVIQNIQSYIKHVDKLYLIDNSESVRYSSQQLYNFLQGIIIIQDGNNEGIAKRLNQACNLAIEDSYDFLLTMDQDSFFDKGDINQYMNCLQEFNQLSTVSMIGVNYKIKNTQSDCAYSNTKFLITSGSVINLKNYKNVGGFDENLFIDFVDIEYCFRSIKKSFEIIEFENVFMQHSLGKLFEKYSLKTLKKTPRSLHSSIRLYYMLRNFLYVKSLYKDDVPQELKILKKDVFNRIKNKLLYANKRWQTIKLLYKAISDYRKSKMGKI